jgi:cytochrome c oxidase subunit 4
MTQSTPSIFREQVGGAPVAKPKPHGEDSADGHGIAHPVPPIILVSVFLALMVLTGITVAARWWDFGYNANLVIAITIAVIKATLVVAYFMHLRYDNLFYTAIVGLCIIFIGVFILTTCLDTDQYQPILTPTNVQPAAAS